MARVIYEVNSSEFIVKLAEELKKIKDFESPDWVAYVKSGVSKERVPANEDFWFLRSASILRQLYIRGVVGVGKLRTRYGSRKNRGGKPSRFKKSSGKLIRVILQSAEKAGFVEKVSKMQFGRRLTPSGKEFLDKVAESLIKSQKEIKKSPNENKIEEKEKIENGKKA